MTAQMPAIFVSHGSPMLALDGSPAHHYLQGLADELPRPKDILVVSAHWETKAPTVSTVAVPETIHDFGGFAPELYEMQYPAPGAPDLGARTAALLEDAGFEVGRSPSRGLDHGAWVPLRLIYPDADIPVTQLSVQPDLGPKHHLQLGRALRPLREQGTLVLASGAVTHNLAAFFRGRFAVDAAAPDWVREFAEWVAAAIRDGRVNDLLNYRDIAPFGAENHPTDEHFLPLFVALGAASDGMESTRMHESYAYGILAMDVYGVN